MGITTRFLWWYAVNLDEDAPWARNHGCCRTADSSLNMVDVAPWWGIRRVDLHSCYAAFWNIMPLRRITPTCALHLTGLEARAESAAFSRNIDRYTVRRQIPSAWNWACLRVPAGCAVRRYPRRCAWNARFLISFSVLFSSRYQGHTTTLTCHLIRCRWIFCIWFSGYVAVPLFSRPFL